MNIFDLIKKRIAKIGTYRIINDCVTYDKTAFIVQVNGLMGWHNVKTFVSDDVHYARLCAEELLDMLNEEIEPANTAKD